MARGRRLTVTRRRLLPLFGQRWPQRGYAAPLEGRHGAASRRAKRLPRAVGRSPPHRGGADYSRNSTGMPFETSSASSSRVPVHEPDAAMAPGLVDKVRLRRAVNSVGRFRQIDPYGTHRAVGPRRNFERLLVVPLLEILVGIVRVGRVLHDDLDLVRARWRRVAGRADGCRIGGDQTIIVIRKQLAGGTIDDDAGCFSVDLFARRRDQNLVARRRKVGIGVQKLEQALVHVKAFGQHFLWSGVAKPFQLGHLGIVIGNLFDIAP